MEYWKFREELAGVHRPESWGLMSNYLSEVKSALSEFIIENKKSIVGFGASATGTVLMRYMDIESSIVYIVDDNPMRQNLFAPGTAIPVKSPSELTSDDLCLILAWRHSNRIIPKLQERSISYIIPLPTFQVSKQSS